MPSTISQPEEVPFNPVNPNKKEGEFRNYQNSARQAVVERTYKLMHTHQTFEFSMQKRAQWCKLDKAEMTIFEALDLLNQLVDDSDPDTNLPNSMHAFQTAERIRRDHPNEDWFHLTGLIHDLGKVLALWGEPQWATVGDTFPLGCKFSDKCVFPDTFSENPDSSNPKYNTEYGIYTPNCGLDEVTMSWGHDEYMYQVMVGNTTTLPLPGLYVIRYHSFYPWHKEGAYGHLLNERDREMFKWIKEFNKYDLYSKSDDLPDVEALKPYYQSLIDKYMPGKLRW